LEIQVLLRVVHACSNAYVRRREREWYARGDRRDETGQHGDRVEDVLSEERLVRVVPVTVKVTSSLDVAGAAAKYAGVCSGSARARGTAGSRRATASVAVVARSVNDAFLRIAMSHGSE